jgi:signal transduction histidine kinase
MSIRFKVILPYLLLTLLVAIIGVYVVTRLVASSLNERLTNQLLESGRVVSDGVVRQEIKHVETARIVAYTSGVADAVQQADREAVRVLVLPAVVGLDAENLILVDLQGQELFHVIKQNDGSLIEITSPAGAGSLYIIQTILNSSDPQIPPQRGVGQNPVNQKYYYYTAISVLQNGHIVGAVLIGTPVDTLLPYLKNVSLADVILYGRDGCVISTTLGVSSLEAEFLASLAIPVEDYDQIIVTDGIVKGENFKVENRWYSLARGPLMVGSDRLAVFAVVLPMDYVIQPGSASRDSYIAIFGGAMVATVVIGFAVSRLIINPLTSLVRTSQAISRGDLDRRSGIVSKDEIGDLAVNFDNMTETLQQRNAELQRMCNYLEQMDRTKVRFIEISAHELRTPLTVAKAYSQMVHAKTTDKPEVQPMTKGLVEGIERMIEIVNSMLDVSKIDSKTLEVHPDQVVLRSIISQVQMTFQAALKERKLALIVIGLDDVPTIKTDPDLTYKLFYHLVMNAIKYTPDGGRITIHGRKLEEPGHAPEVEITVQDTGIGIDKEYQEVIFEKFFQIGEVMLHSSGKTKFKGGGPGLGLSIAKGIVVAHGGRIWVESPGHDESNYPGSKFFVRLPVARSQDG